MSQSLPSSAFRLPPSGAVPPAWARSLIALRMSGRHPMLVNVALGGDWSRAREYWDAVRFGARNLEPFSPAWRKRYGDPWLAVGRDALAAGGCDFRCVAGCAVRVHDSDGLLAGPEDGAVFDLMGALARQAAQVFLEPAVDGCASLACLAACRRSLNRAWPRWWCDEIDVEHERKRKEWSRAFVAFDRASAA